MSFARRAFMLRLWPRSVLLWVTVFLVTVGPEIASSQQQELPAPEAWEALNRGELQAAQYKRLGKNGKEIWIQARS